MPNTLTWISRYQQAHEQWFKVNYPAAYSDGHYAMDTMPNWRKSGGLMTMIEKFCKWTGHHCERTHTMGTPQKKLAPRFNLISGKVEHYEVGTEWRTTSALKGSSDMKGHVNCKSGLPVAIYVEIKIGHDKQSTDQLGYESIVKRAGGFYTIVKTPDDWFKFFDYVVSL